MSQKVIKLTRKKDAADKVQSAKDNFKLAHAVWSKQLDHMARSFKTIKGYCEITNVSNKFNLDELVTLDDVFSVQDDLIAWMLGEYKDVLDAITYDTLILPEKFSDPFEVLVDMNFTSRDHVTLTPKDTLMEIMKFQTISGISQAVSQFRVDTEEELKDGNK